MQSARPVHALQIAGGSIFANDAPRLAELALQAGLPTICEWRDMARSGCLIGYGVDRAALRLLEHTEPSKKR